jgi:hypothetical protein
MSGEYNPSGKRTPKCREVVRILSQSMDSKLSLIMRIKLRLHYLICAWCQRYDKQLHELREFTSSVPSHLDDFSADTLSPLGQRKDEGGA